VNCVDSLSQFLNYRVRKILDACQLSGVPVDLHEVAKASGVLSVDACEMIPEGAICVEAHGFRIRLQSNFSGLPGMRLRQRFSFAHEIAHTLFYELRNGQIQPVPKAPKGNRLESACHEAAAMILVPDRLLTKELQGRSSKIDSEFIVQLAATFEVSLEVILRRLVEVRVLDSTYLAFALVRRDKSAGEKIDFAMYPPWLKAFLRKPARGTDFSTWFFGSRDAHAANTPDGLISRRLECGRLNARALDIRNSMRLYEIGVERHP
jgi:hypothetical protein